MYNVTSLPLKLMGIVPAILNSSLRVPSLKAADGKGKSTFILVSTFIVSLSKLDVQLPLYYIPLFYHYVCFEQRVQMSYHY